MTSGGCGALSLPCYSDRHRRERRRQDRSHPPQGHASRDGPVAPRNHATRRLAEVLLPLPTFWNAVGQDKVLAPFRSVRSGFSLRRWGCGVSEVSAGLGRRALLACSSKRWTGEQHKPRRTKMAGPARPVWGGRTRPLREDTPYRPCIDTTHLFGGAHPSNGTFFAKGTIEQIHHERCPTPTRLLHRKILFCLMHSPSAIGSLAWACSQAF